MVYHLLLIHLVLQLAHCLAIHILHVTLVLILYLIRLVLVVEDLLEVVLDVPPLCILDQVKITISIDVVKVLENLWVEVVVVMQRLLIHLHIWMYSRQITKTNRLHGDLYRLFANRLNQVPTLILALINVVLIVVLFLFDLILIDN